MPDIVIDPIPNEGMDAEAYFYRGTRYSLQEDYENAIADLTTAIRLDPSNAKYHYNRGNQHVIISRWEAAVADYSEAIRLTPDPTDDDSWNFTLDEAYRERAISYRYLGNYDAAISDFTEAISFRPSKSYDYRDRSVTYRLAGNFEKALADIDIMQQIDPNDSEPFTLRALVYEAQGNLSAAMTEYDEQIIRFQTPAAYIGRGELWIELGNLTQAITDLEAAKDFYAGYYRPVISLAEKQISNGRFAEAISTLNIIIERALECRYIGLLLRARAQMGLGNADAAKEDFEKCIFVTTGEIAKHAEFVDGYVTRAQAYSSIGKISEAVQDYEKALEILPAHPDAAAIRGYINDLTHQ